MAVTWGADTPGGTQLTAVNDTVEEFFDVIVSSDALLTQVEILANNESGSVVNGLIVSVYLSLDESTQDWDDEPFMSREFIPAGNGEEKFTFFLPSIGGSWRVGCLASAVTDDYTVDMNYRERTA